MNSKLIKKSILSLMLVTVLVLNLFMGTFAQTVEVPPAELYPEKETAFEWLDTYISTYQNMSDVIWSYAELGMQEYKTSELVSDHLEKAGFEVERGVAGMPTCFTATYGSGEPVIVFMGELDALPSLSQKANVAEEDPVVPGAPGHGCGHNQQAPVAAAAGIAVKKAMDEHGLEGTIKVYGAPAEETLISRPYMVRAGLFDGVTAVFGDHGGSSFGGGVLGGISGGNAMFSTLWTFYGDTAHSAGQPWDGRSALDGVEMMNIATEFLREHLHFGYRLHYVIPNGGEAPNVVPNTASVWYFVRNSDERLLDMYERVQNCAEAAALATGTEVEERVYSAVHQAIRHAGITKLAHQNSMLVGLPEWSEEEERFAKAVQRELGREEIGRPKELSPLREWEPDECPHTGGGSTDIAEVSRNVPYVTIRIPADIPGDIGHHWSRTVGNIGTANDKAVLVAAKAMAGSGLDLMTDPSLVQEFNAEFEEMIEKYGEYESYLPPDSEPPVDLNKQLMEKYRPLMEEHYIEFTEEIFE